MIKARTVRACVKAKTCCMGVRRGMFPLTVRRGMFKVTTRLHNVMPYRTLCVYGLASCCATDMAWPVRLLGHGMRHVLPWFSPSSRLPLSQAPQLSSNHGQGGVMRRTRAAVPGRGGTVL
jgi:hypothetical protein